MRRATWEDRGVFLRLRNGEEARRMSRRCAWITPDEHAAWYTRALRRGALFIEEGIGVVRIARNGEVSIIIEPGQRGQGYGEKLLRSALRRVSAPVYRATVHRGNARSLILFIKTGFVPQQIRGWFLYLTRRGRVA